MDNDNFGGMDFVDLRNNGHEPPRPEPKRFKGSTLIKICILAAAVFFGFHLFTGFFTGPHGSLPAGGVNITGQVSNLDVSLVNSAIIVTSHVGNDIRVNFTPPATGGYRRPSYDFSGGGLRIYDQRRMFMLFSFGGGGSLTISLPEGDPGIVGMGLSTTNGRISVMGSHGNRLANNLSISTTNGAIEVGNFFVDNNAEISTTNGAVTLHSIEAGGDLTARTTNGRIEGANLNAWRDLTMRTTNGAVALSNSRVAGLLTARTTNGGVNITNVDADMDRADLGTTNGRVTIN